MDRNYIDRYLVIDRYLQGRLAEDEEAEFEERLVWDRALVDEVDLAEKLQAGLRTAHADSQYLAGESRGVAWRLRGLLSTPRYAAAASFVIGALLATMTLNIPDARIGSVTPGATTNVVPLLVLRSADVQTIPVAPAGMTVLMVDVPEADATYRVSIRRGDADEPFWTRDGLVPGYLQALAVGIPDSSLAPEAYVLRVEGMAGEAEAFEQEIPFRTVPVESVAPQVR